MNLSIISLRTFVMIFVAIGLLSCLRLGYYGDSVYLTFDFFSWQFRELLTFGFTYIFAR